ncbi:hypothetical protein Hanom_Chr00s000001g01593431 [Helianthus anomalus]
MRGWFSSDVGFILLIRSNLQKKKKKKTSIMLIPDCKLYPLSSISKKNILDVCKPLHVMSLSPNSVSFHG